MVARIHETKATSGGSHVPIGWDRWWRFPIFRPDIKYTHGREHITIPSDFAVVVHEMNGSTTILNPHRLKLPKQVLDKHPEARVVQPPPPRWLQDMKKIFQPG